MSSFEAKRLWVNEALREAQRLLFLANDADDVELVLLQLDDAKVGVEDLIRLLRSDEDQERR